MPARHTSITVNQNAPALLTDGAVDAVRVFNQGNVTVGLQATSTSTPPVSLEGFLALSQGQTLAADLTLAQLFPGVGSGALYLWAFTRGVTTKLSVSHA